MDSNVREIDIIKKQVKQLINDNLFREVTPESNHNLSGVYMIYIDNFTSEKVVPIYIGQAKDIQRRYKQHVSEILALNRLSYDEYNKYFFSKSHSFYEGKYKACKLFKYMLENDCTLQDLRMIVLEEVDVKYLDKKEQDYFQRLLPSFFGFNQLNSFLFQLKFRFSNARMNNLDIDNYLTLLLEDINGIHSYYDYGFTRFNFEHSIPRDISKLLKNEELLDNDIVLKFDEVKMSLFKLCKQFLPDFEELEKLRNEKSKLYEVYKPAEDECDKTLDNLELKISEKLEELRIYSKEAVNNFIHSIKYKNNPKYKEHFRKYLKTLKCTLDFYGLFDKQIKLVNSNIEERNTHYSPYSEVLNLYLKRMDEMRYERYKMIFPSCQFESHSLGDRSKKLTRQFTEEFLLLNTCHIHIYVSNNGVNRSDIRKEPFIIRFDYCYIDNEGNKKVYKYYIDNETTRNCQSGIEYFEKDYYDMWAINPEKFKMSSVIDNQTDNSFISVLAEYKHGINDYTIKGKHLVNLSDVLDEIQQKTNDETGFSIIATESYRCLKLCMMNEGLQNNPFVEKLLTKKLPKVKKSRTSPIKNVKVKNNELKNDNKVARSEAYKQKVLKKSENAINVLNYVSSREKVTAQCNVCGYEWKIRSDHLLSRPYCPSCIKNKMT